MKTPPMSCVPPWNSATVKGPVRQNLALRTAMELGDGQGPVRQNLAVAYLLTDNWGGLEWMKKQYGLSSEERAYAERLAEQFGR